MSTDSHHQHAAGTSNSSKIEHLRTEAPIIIIGNGGSGSTLLDRILNAHPDISMQGEMKFLAARAWIAFWGADANTMLRNIKKYFDSDPDLGMRLIEAPEIYQDFLRKLENSEFQRTGAVLREAIAKWFCLGDKSAGNWGFKEIANGGEVCYDWKIYDHIFPQACWVHIVRHPLRQVHAAARLNNQALTEAAIPRLLIDWLKTIKKSRERAATGRYFEIRYEDLVKAPKRVLTPLLDQIGVAWQEECRLPLARQWGPASEWRPLPKKTLEKIFNADRRRGALAKLLPLPSNIQNRLFNLEELSALDGLSEMISSLGYQQDPTESDLPPEPKALPPTLDADSNEQWNLSGSMMQEEGKCWQFDFSRTPLGDKLAAIADDIGFWRRSPLRLFENGMPLGPVHALHFHIRGMGRGAFSHWQNRLLFSTSDNTNPNSNGRVYSFDLKGGE